MFKALGCTFYEEGDIVAQNDYANAGPATIIEVLVSNTKEGLYRATVTLPEGHDDAFDENGESEHVKVFVTSKERIEGIAG